MGPGLHVNLYSLPTAYAMSGVVHVIAYIKDPMIFEYSNCETICLVCLANFIPDSMGLEIEIVSSMPNLLSIFSM